MIIRVYIACLLSFACAENITRVQGAGESDGLYKFGHFELEEATQPSTVSATNDTITLKDVKFISKISPTESLLVTDKNLTWKYNDVEDTLEEITYKGDKKPYESGGFKQSGEAEYGFSKQLLRMYVSSGSVEAKLVVNHSTDDNSSEFSVPVPLRAAIYDATNPPRILYLNAEIEERVTPSILMYTKDRLVLNSATMDCDNNKKPSSVEIRPTGGNKGGFSNDAAGGIGSDGRSFWVLTADKFALYLWGKCGLITEKDASGKDKVDSQNNPIQKPNHTYNPFKFDKKSQYLKVSYADKDASKLPLGVWLNVADKTKPFVEGKIIAISEDGKLLSSK